MDLSLTLAQKQILSQKMRQSAEILQMTTIALSEYMQEIAIENPVVEWEEEVVTENDRYEKLRRKLEWLDASDEQNKRYYQEEREDEQENDDWKFRQEEKQTLQESLLFQINILYLSNEVQKAARYLVDCVHDSGYLEEWALEEAARKFGLTEMEKNEVLETVQSLEPAGVFARSLKECLLLQLRRLEKRYPLCEEIVEHYLDYLAKNQLHIIAKKCKVKIVEVVAASEKIKGLNPKPGSGFAVVSKTDYIIPDAVVKYNGSGFDVVLNQDYIPKMKINGYYKDVLLSDTSEAAKEYITGKIRQAEWIQQCIMKREATLLTTVQSIVQWQQDFFKSQQGQLKPMRLIDIAEKMGVHESTVSRAVRGKYLQCDKGLFGLQYFFTSSVSGGNSEKVSAENVKNLLKEMIEKEDKLAPYSDQKLAELLQEQGVKISRRTVTKYRESLGVSGISGRRQYKQ